MDWLNSLLPGLAWTAAAIATVVLFDSTIGRWLSGKIATTYSMYEMPGGSPESEALVLYMPGVLHGKDSIEEIPGADPNPLRGPVSQKIRDAMLEQVAGGMFVSYGYWRFFRREVVAKTAEAIGYARKHNPSQRYTSVIMFGGSFGARLTADLKMTLQADYGWEPEDLPWVPIDTGCENNSFQKEAFTASLVLRKLYIGPLISLVARLFIKLVLVPPYDENIQPGLNLRVVKRVMLSRMAKFMLSCSADQARYLADNAMEWTMNLKGADIIYLQCVFDNVTIAQPGAMNRIRLYTEGSARSFSYYLVPSPHCGFAQLPDVWADVFSKVITQVLESRRTNQYN